LYDANIGYGIDDRWQAYVVLLGVADLKYDAMDERWGDWWDTKITLAKQGLLMSSTKKPPLWWLFC
jgi:hypothetical protein